MPNDPTTASDRDAHSEDKADAPVDAPAADAVAAVRERLDEQNWTPPQSRMPPLLAVAEEQAGEGDEGE